MTTNKTIDGALDRFSKAHPFADTKAYNIHHDQTKQAITQAMLDAVPKVLDENAPRLLVRQINQRKGFNKAIDQMEAAIKKRGRDENTHSL